MICVFCLANGKHTEYCNELKKKPVYSNAQNAIHYACGRAVIAGYLASKEINQNKIEMHERSLDLWCDAVEKILIESSKEVVLLEV